MTILSARCIKVLIRAVFLQRILFIRTVPSLFCQIGDLGSSQVH